MIREYYEELEEKLLSPYGMLSSRSKGRDIPMEKCAIRTEFQRDRDRILHCKSFRRLKHKTQVFIAPEGDHYRTRLTHTLEVAQIARTIAKALSLNEDLTEAIALGHDLGHTPFGHTGERCIRKITSIGFRHNEQSLRVVEVLENGTGLNLTWEVRDGILNHTRSGEPSSLEGQVVGLSDRIAYINHDIDDALRAGVLKQEDLPKESMEILGDTHGKRMDVMISDVIFNSMDQARVMMSSEVSQATERLRDFMFDAVYLNPIAKGEEGKASHVVEQLYWYFRENLDKLPEEYIHFLENYEEEQVVCDYIAGMTDRYAIKMYHSLFIPSSWRQF